MEIRNANNNLCAHSYWQDHITQNGECSPKEASHSSKKFDASKVIKHTLSNKVNSLKNKRLQVLSVALLKFKNIKQIFTTALRPFITAYCWALGAKEDIIYLAHRFSVKGETSEGLAYEGWRSETAVRHLKKNAHKTYTNLLSEPDWTNLVNERTLETKISFSNPARFVKIKGSSYADPNIEKYLDENKDLKINSDIKIDENASSIMKMMTDISSDFDSSVSDKESALKKLSDPSTEFILLVGGARNHCVCAFMMRDGNDWIIARCNRGKMGNPPGVILHRINSEPIEKNPWIHKFLDSFLPQSLLDIGSLEDFNSHDDSLKFEGYIPLKKQRTGNCTVSSTNALERTILYCKLKKMGYSDHDSMVISKSLQSFRTSDTKRGDYKSFLSKLIKYSKRSFLVMEWSLIFDIAAQGKKKGDTKEGDTSNILIEWLDSAHLTSWEKARIRSHLLKSSDFYMNAITNNKMELLNYISKNFDIKWETIVKKALNMKKGDKTVWDTISRQQHVDFSFLAKLMNLASQEAPELFKYNTSLLNLFKVQNLPFIKALSKIAQIEGIEAKKIKRVANKNERNEIKTFINKYFS